MTWASLYAHLLDETEWGLLSDEEACAAAKELLALSGLEQESETSRVQPVPEESDAANARGGTGKARAEEPPGMVVHLLSRRYLDAFARKIICTAGE